MVGDVIVVCVKGELVDDVFWGWYVVIVDIEVVL